VEIRDIKRLTEEMLPHDMQEELVSRAVAELEGMLGVWRHFGTSARQERDV